MFREHNDRSNNRSIPPELLQSKGIVEDGKRIKKELRDMTTKRFIVDDAGTLIDMKTRETYDYVSDVCLVLNELNDENEQLKESNERFSKTVAEQIIMIKEYREENEQLKQHIQTLQKQTKRLENDNIQTYTLIKEALANERTSIGQSVLKQLLNRIEE